MCIDDNIISSYLRDGFRSVESLPPRSSRRKTKHDFSLAKLGRFALQLSLVINDYRGRGDSRAKEYNDCADSIQQESIVAAAIFD